MTHDYGKASLFRFLDFLLAKGLANKNTGGALKSACDRLLSDLSAEEEADVRRVDVALAARRFANKNQNLLSPQSLGEYQRRTEKAIAEFVRYQNAPTTYSGLSRASTRKRTDSGDKPKAKAGAGRTSAPSVPPKLSGAPAPQVISGLTHEFPLRRDFLAQIVLPRDLRAEEAKRLAAFIGALAVDFDGD